MDLPDECIAPDNGSLYTIIRGEGPCLL